MFLWVWLHLDCSINAAFVAAFIWNSPVQITFFFSTWNKNKIKLALTVFFNTFFSFSITSSFTHARTLSCIKRADFFFLSPIKLHFLTRLILSNLELPVVSPPWCAATELCVCAFSQAHTHTYICECKWGSLQWILIEKMDCNQHILIGNH